MTNTLQPPTRLLPDSADLFDEGATPALTSFYLGTDTGRFQFLWALSELGEDSLILATHHVWNSLNPPQALRAALIAKAAGIEGSGKSALYQVLKYFLETFEDECQPPPLPERSAYATSVDWHTAVRSTCSCSKKPRRNCEA